MTNKTFPNEWIEVMLDEVVDRIVGGGTPSKAIPSYFQGSIPWMTVKDMNKFVLNDTVDHISEEAVQNSATNIIPAGTPIVATRMSLGKLVRATFDSAINQDLKAIFINEKVSKIYFEYWYRSIAQKIQEMGTGTTVKGIRLEDIKQLSFALAPLAEQQQIAQKLDELLAQVDTLKTRLDAIPKILKRFRQSVLAAAVSGRLTQEWRGSDANEIQQVELKDLENFWAGKYKAQNRKFKLPKIASPEFEIQDLPRSWLGTQLGYVFDVYVGATPSRSDERFWGGSVSWVSSSEVAFCRIKNTKEKITEQGLSAASTHVHPKGTVMLAMIGQGKTRGQVAILDIEACHNQNTAALRIPTKFASSEYLYFYLSKQYEETRRVGGGNNQQALNKATVQGLNLPLPPLEEQVEIVRRVEQLFAYADQIEQRVKDAQARVNYLTQSILAKAFRGELTADWRAQNPELISGENSAAALLERIKAEREVVGKAKKKKA